MKKRPATPQKFYNVLTTSENTDSATILMYGFIGEEYDWYTGEQTGVTDIEFVQELEALAAKYNTIHLRINSPGGQIFHGSAMVTAIRNCKAEVHTWIDGVAASMAGIIWMAGHKRHMAKNAMLMIHSAGNICWGNAKDMREVADTLDKFDSSLIISAADSVGMSEEEMRKKYFNYEDHWLTYNDVEAEKWLTSPDDYQAAAKLPTDITNMSYRDLLAYFDETDDSPEELPSWLDRARGIFEEAKREIKKVIDPSSSLSKSDMNIQDFQASLADGRLSLADVQNHLASLKPAEPSDAEPSEEGEDDEIKAIRSEMADMKAQLKALGELPGAGKSLPGPTEHDAPGAQDLTAEARLNAFNQATFAAAEKNEPAMFEPAA